MDLSEKFAPIRKGLLEFLVLKVIAKGDVYAADILAALESTDFSTQEGTLYPLLSKIRRDGTADYSWQESQTGPPRKYYRLTAKGKKQLEETKKYWKDIIHTIDTIGS